MSRQGRSEQGLQYHVITIELVPETWIIAPVATKEQLKRYHREGWIDEEKAEHLDRAFPRNADGKPIIFKMWLLSPMKKALRRLGYPRELLNEENFSIVDDDGFPVEYIVIPDEPLAYKRVILTETEEEEKKEKEREEKKKESKKKEKKKKQTLEYFELIDSTYKIRFKVRTPYPKEIVEILTLAGKIGLMARTSKGFGKFRIKVIGT